MKQARRNRWLILAAFLYGIVGASFSAQYTLTITTHAAPVRAEQSLLSAPLLTLKKGDVVTAVGKSLDWYKIETADGGIGYVQASDVEAVAMDAPSADIESAHGSLTIGKRGATLYSETWAAIAVLPAGAQVAVTALEETWASVLTKDGRRGRILLSQAVESDEQQAIDTIPAPPMEARAEVSPTPPTVPSRPVAETEEPRTVSTPAVQDTALGPATVTTQEELIRDVVVERESKSIDARIELDLTATGYNNDEKRRSASATTKAGLEYAVERGSQGYWFSGAIEVDFDYSKVDTAESDAAGIKILGFNEWGWDDFSAYGRKWYLTPQSPYFFYSEAQARWEKRDDGSTDSRDRPATNIAGGIGYGRVVDIASYERIIIVQNELMAAGILRTRIPRAMIRQLLPYYIRSMDHYDRMKETQDILLANGFIDADDITLDISYEIYDAIASSFDKRKYGLELRAAYFQEISKENKDMDKYGYLSFYLKWEYPLGRQHQLSVKADASSRITGEQDEVRMSLETELSSVFGRYVESQIGIRGDHAANAVETTTKVAFGELTYDLTDVVSWDNRFQYNWNEDSSTSFSFTSSIVYNIY